MTEAPPVQRLEHWTLVATDVERTKQFYTQVLGAETPKRNGGPTSVSFAGTIIDFFPSSAEAQPSPGSTGQHHAYIVHLEDYDAWVAHLRQNGVPYRLATHGKSRMSIYVDDPDGYHIELTVPFESAEIGRREIAKRGLTARDD